MIIIGEKLNSSIKNVYEIMQNKDEDALKELIIAQEQAGADYLDANAGAFLSDEQQYLEWLIEKINTYADIPPVIDTPNSEIALKIAEKYSAPKAPIINSITLEKHRFDNMLNAAKCCDAGIVALCADDDEETDCCKIAYKLVDKLVQGGITYDKIYVDPSIKPLASGTDFGVQALNNIKKIRQELPEVHIICGLSNVSFGLPKRSVINSNFLAVAMSAGLDSAILNPLNKDIMTTIYAQNVILGKDDYCMDYIQAFRDDKL